MAVNLVELVKGYLTPDILRKGAILCRRVRVSDAKGNERHRADFDRGCWQIKPRRPVGRRDSAVCLTRASTMVARSTI